MRVVVAPSFFDEAEQLRSQFEGLVRPIRSVEEKRFVWDYWHIPGQYTYFRTLAINVIRPSLLGALVGALSNWGLANLGTGQISSPWLSFYIEGCRQELHTDVVQGMWSYVYSLTHWDDRHFTGGETLLGSDRLLEYWERFNPTKSLESRHLIERIPPRFNQLCVFDSRLPHGVAQVEGTRDPLRARVALHGWFHNPEPTFSGSMRVELAQPALGLIFERWSEQKSRFAPYNGQATWLVSIRQEGNVDDVSLVVENFVGGNTDELLTAGASIIGQTTFPSSEGDSTLLLPLG